MKKEFIEFLFVCINEKIDMIRECDVEDRQLDELDNFICKLKDLVLSNESN